MKGVAHCLERAGAAAIGNLRARLDALTGDGRLDRLVVFTRERAAGLVGVSLDTVDRWADAGFVAKVETGRGPRITAASLRRMAGQEPQDLPPLDAAVVARGKAAMLLDCSLPTVDRLVLDGVLKGRRGRIALGSLAEISNTGGKSCI
ncbi:MAG: hypothetical protein CMO68_06055 [Verrucomicrobiales bacterium]|nr:hypothetical protein [Verrucomicrobiales bacterium]